jgi:hypothetical protein
MFKLRKGDLGKAIALIAAIVALGFFIVRTLVAASRPPAVAGMGARAAGASEAEDASGAPTEGRRLFAHRPRTPLADIARAQTAPDPFRPYVTVRQAGSGDSGSGGGSAVVAAELGALRLTGIISSPEQPLAALTDGPRHYYLRVGETLPGGWRLVAVGTSTVTLAKGRQRVELGLRESGRGTRR